MCYVKVKNYEHDNYETGLNGALWIFPEGMQQNGNFMYVFGQNYVVDN